MIPSIKIYHDTRHLDKSGCAPLVYVIRHNGSVAYLPTGIKIKPEEWNGSEVIKHTNKVSLNRHLISSKINIEDLIIDITRRLTNPKASDIKNELELILNPQKVKSSLSNFISHFEAFAKSHHNNRTVEIYSSTLQHIKRFDKNACNLNFEDITLNWLNRFDAYLCKKSSSINGRSIHFRNIRAVFNNAIDNDLTDYYPMRKFKIKSAPTKKRSFNVETLRMIFNAEVPEWLKRYQDIFKLTFLLIGINFIDLFNLREISNGRIEYIRAKTNKPYSIKVEPEALELIENLKGTKGLLNFSDNYKHYRSAYIQFDKGLKQLRDHLGLPELSLYWARHSWATIASELDIPVETISAALGHSYGNPTTAIYINFNQKKVDEANRKVIDYVLDNNYFTKK